jgi:transcriptional regulator with XRE-family HTH domain
VTPEQSFAVRLRERRSVWHLSQQEVADQMRLEGFRWRQTTVAKIEGGKRPLLLNEAVALDGLFKVGLV